MKTNTILIIAILALVALIYFDRSKAATTLPAPEPAPVDPNAGDTVTDQRSDFRFSKTSGLVSMPDWGTRITSK